MVTDSDLQVWQNAVNGINESGKIDLTQEEWSALSVLNGCLINGKFLSDESSRSYQVLNDNLNNHGNNPALHTHLYNFIALYYKYATAQPTVTVQKTPIIPTTSTTSGNQPINTHSTAGNRTQQTNTSGQTNIVQQKVDIFIRSNSENFNPEDLITIKQKLEQMDDSKFSLVQGIGFQKPSTIFLIAIFLGWERFLLDDIGMGVLKVLTAYGCGIWWLVDIFSAKDRAKKYNFKKFTEAAMMAY